MWNQAIDELLAELHQTLSSRKLTIATAESCTGGLIAAALTSTPGCSPYFLGGVAAYSNQAKVDILGIGEPLLEKFGAVSQEVAEAMAAAAVRLFGADIGIGITGIAGPDGGKPGKPVGTVWLGVQFGDTVRSRNLGLHGDRRQIRLDSTYEALNDIQRIMGN